MAEKIIIAVMAFITHLTPQEEVLVPLDEEPPFGLVMEINKIEPKPQFDMEEFIKQIEEEKKEEERLAKEKARLRQIEKSKETWHQPCNLNSTFKSYMDYRAITNRSSKQWKLQQKAYTENGYRKIDGRIMVAMANYPAGQELDIHLASGEVIYAIMGDVKANTSCTHPDGSILEFVVDTKTMDNNVRRAGNYNTVHEGAIAKIKVGKQH